jgi:hypothetical protein
MAVTVNWVGEKVFDGSNNTDLLGIWSGTTNTDFFIEGTNSSSDVAKAATKTAAFSGAAITSDPYDFTSTGTIGTVPAPLDVSCIYIWVLMLGAPNTLAAGGFGIVAADDLATDSYGIWYVGPRPDFIGGWQAFCVHPSRNFASVVAGSGSWTTTGNPAQLTGIDGIGGHVDVTNSIMGNFDNCFIDAISIGTGYELTGNTPDGVFSDFSDFEDTTSGRFAGLFTKAATLFAQCQLTIGDVAGALNTDFTDDGFTVTWIDINTSTQSAVEADFYAMFFAEDTGTTNITLSNGNFIAESPQEFRAEFAGITSGTLNAVNISRASIVNLDSNITWSLGNISNSGTINLDGQPTLTDISIIDPTDGFAMEVNATNELDNVTNISFDGAGVGGAGNGAVYVNITGAGPFTLTFDNFTFANPVAGSDAIVIAANGNADYTLNISGITASDVNNLGTGSVTIVNSVNYTIDNIIASSEVRVFDFTGSVVGTEVSGGTNSIANTDTLTTGSITFALNQNQSYLAKVFLPEYDIVRFSFNSGVADGTRRVDQTIDRVYSNPT